MHLPFFITSADIISCDDNFMRTNILDNKSKMMRKINPFHLLVLLLFACTCACQEDEMTGKNMQNFESEQIFINGKIYTVNPSQEWAEAILVIDGVIEFVGTTTAVQDRASEDAEVINLDGALVLPGIHDVHMHPLEAASENFHFIIEEGITDPEDYAFDAEQAAQENPGSDWILGWGYDLEILLEAKRLPKEILDDVVSDRPIGIMELTSHSIWCNSKALELMNIDDKTENPTGGIIMREQNGEANGILIDNAGNLLIDLALPVTPESLNNDYNGLKEYALPELAKHGITSICDARTYWKRDHHKTWKKLADDDELTARVNLGLWAYPTEEDDTQLSTLKSIYEFNQNSLLKINQIKLYCDGIIHNTTSAMHGNFLLDYFGEDTNNGLNYFTQERIQKYITELEATGFDFHIHTIGNRGVNEALNAIQLGGGPTGRHRLTHVEYIDKEDISRFRQLNATADAQVAGDFTNPEHWHDFDHLIGEELAENVVPIKSLNEAGARLCLSSDWDVSSLNPFVGMQNAVSRVPQNISLAEAVRAYTLNPAYVMRQEQIVGSIEVGKEADLIILNQNIFEIDANQIAQTEVLQTFLQGELIYQK